MMTNYSERIDAIVSSIKEDTIDGLQPLSKTQAAKATIAITNLIREAEVRARIDELDSIVFDETDVSDIERFEHQNDGMPMLTIQPPYTSRRISQLKTELGKVSE